MSKRYNNNNNSSFFLAILCLIAIVALLAVGANQLTDLLPDDDPSQNNGNNTTQTDPDACKHSSTTVTCKSLDAEQHEETKVCNDCEKIISVVTKAHDFNADGVCSGAGCTYACPHTAATSIVYVYSAMNQHAKQTRCSACNAVRASELEKHDFVNGVCSKYGCAYTCIHSGDGISYSAIDGNDDVHLQMGNCTNCGLKFDQEEAAHVYLNGTCTKCKHTCDHTDMQEVKLFNGVDGHLVTRKCPHGCGLNESETVACTFDPATGICTVCAGEHKHVAAAGVTLGFDEDRQTSGVHVRQTACAVCDYVYYVTEPHTFEDGANYCASGCGFYCEHEAAYSYRSSGDLFTSSHVVITSCTKCANVLSEETEECSEWVTNSVNSVSATGHSVSRSCSLCGASEMFHFGEHENEICGCCKVCGAYANGGMHYRATLNGGTCVACGHPADPDKQYD